LVDRSKHREDINIEQNEQVFIILTDLEEEQRLQDVLSREGFEFYFMAQVGHDWTLKETIEDIKFQFRTPILVRKFKQTPTEELPKNLRLEIGLPNLSPKEIEKYMFREFNLDPCLEKELDNYEQLFYNSDLRSICGFIEEWDSISMTFILFTQAFVKGFEKEFHRLLDYAKEIEVVE